ncbi:MAG TPA: ACT domain-containing protein [Thermodesulfobacteriota bacterium]|nr:ACT domain-containing protein [Thermodesulfobacteriota bacterium]
MARQVCIFAENKPGRPERITKILKEARINMRAITIATSQGFGIIKLIVNDPEKTIEVLRSKGLTAYSREVIAVLMDDQPGGLHKVAEVFARKEINVEDAYGFVVQDKKRAVMIFDVESMPEAVNILTKAGFVLLNDEELYSL